MADNETPLEMQADWVNVNPRAAQALSERYGPESTNTERPEWRARINIPQVETPVTFGTIDHPRRVTNKRGELLAEAERIVNGARNVQYGDPNADFQTTADLWSTYLHRCMDAWMKNTEPYSFSPHDVAVMMILLKVSRLAWSPEKADSWLDVAGYSACGYDASPALLDNPGTST